MSTTGLRGEYNCTETKVWFKTFTKKAPWWWKWNYNPKNILDERLDNNLSNSTPASCGSITVGMCMSRSVSSGSQTILYSSAGLQKKKTNIKKLFAFVVQCRLKKCNHLVLPLWLFIIRTAEAPAACAMFAFVVNLQWPRVTMMTSPVSYQKLKRSRLHYCYSICNTWLMIHSICPKMSFFFKVVPKWVTYSQGGKRPCSLVEYNNHEGLI